MRATPAGLHRGDCEECSAFYRKNAEANLMVAGMYAANQPIRTIDWYLDQMFQDFHAAGHVVV